MNYVFLEFFVITIKRFFSQTNKKYIARLPNTALSPSHHISCWEFKLFLRMVIFFKALSQIGFLTWSQIDFFGEHSFMTITFPTITTVAMLTTVDTVTTIITKYQMLLLYYSRGNFFTKLLRPTKWPTDRPTNRPTYN